jgi:hypothetical protein
LPGNITSTASRADLEIVARSQPYSITSQERLLALIDAVRYCVRRNVPGDFVECGVWRGGSVLAMILVLQELGVTDRDIYLFDTFDGMTAPTAHDTSQFHPPAVEMWQEAERNDSIVFPEYFDSTSFNQESVRDFLRSTGYPADSIRIVAGKVEETLPECAPDRLALLRLDTDWYESTRHELEHLYPRLSAGGVLIIDDYGHWEGARRAVDEYFSEQPLLLNRIDYTGRIAVKA